MSKLKKILVVGLFLSSTFFMGCDDITGGTNDDTVTPGTLTKDNDTITLQTNLTVSLEVEASSAISSSAFSVAFTKGGTATTKLTATIAYTTDDKGTAAITVSPASDCPTGLYTGTITIVNGEATGTKTFTVYVKGVDEVTKVVSTFSNVKIDVFLADGDATNNCASVDGSTFTYNAGKTDASLQQKCDLVYYVTGSKNAIIAAPNAAPSYLDESYKNWSTLNATKFKKAESTDWTATDSATDANIISASSGASESETEALSAGDVYAFVTDGGKKGLLKVISVVAEYDSNGEITIDIKVQD